MPIPYDPNTPLKSNLAFYQIPATMADCVDQYRLDVALAAISTLNIPDSIFGLVDLSNVEFGTMFDPVACVGDRSLQVTPPGRRAMLPPVPSTVVNEVSELQPEMLLATAKLAKRLAGVANVDVLSFAKLVAVSFCDDSSQDGFTRQEALAYIATNNLHSPAAAMLRSHPALWENRRRAVEIPDMRQVRKDDFATLFAQHGKPLQPHELECVADESLIRYAGDMRDYILEQNRHITFCQSCSNRMVYFNSQVMAPPTDTVM